MRSGNAAPAPARPKPVANEMRRRRRHEEPANHERWLVSYADFITLLFAFFVVMYSISSVNEGKYRVLSSTLIGAFKPGAAEMNPIQLGDMPTRLEPSPPGAFHQESAQLPDPETLIDPMPLEPVPESPSDDQAALSSIAADLSEAVSSYIDRDLIEVTQSQHWIEVEIKSKMLFASGTARISHEALKVMRTIAAILKPLPNVINVEGHTDNVPIRNAMFPSNWELSASRAASVVHIFTRLGIDPRRLAAIGYAEYRPIADNATAAGRQKNRRVSLLIMAGKEEQAGRRVVEAAEIPL